ncbi:MAG TPA: AGE family epimerase/isomerase, partial [Chitinophagaceae bacterium]|nr:AGE family epimerase/isomerase [Chitinophagaceae bacterium]
MEINTSAEQGSYAKTALADLYKFYEGQLLESTIPFWFPRSLDNEYGGFLFMRDADGSLIDDDKAVWIQGRATWMLSTLYNTVEKKEEWLQGAKLGYDFLNKYCFDTDGQMFFHVTRDGKPLRKRRYFFSETFYVIAAAAYAKASGDEEAAHNARKVFGNCLAYASGEKKLQPKYTGTRPAKGIGVPMIMINTAQQLRETIGDPRCD